MNKFNLFNLFRIIITIQLLILFSFVANSYSQNSPYTGEYKGEYDAEYTYKPSRGNFLKGGQKSISGKLKVSISSAGDFEAKHNGKLVFVGKVFKRSHFEDGSKGFEGYVLNTNGTKSLLKGAFKRVPNQPKKLEGIIGMWCQKDNLCGYYYLNFTLISDKSNSTKKLNNNEYDIKECPNVYEGLRYTEDYNFTKAIEQFSLQISKRNKNCTARAYIFRGVTRIKTKKYRQAVSDFTEIIRLKNLKKAREKNSGGISPGDISSGGIRLGDTDNNVNIDSSNVINAYYYRGMAREKLGDRYNSRRDFEEACKLGDKTSCKKVNR